MDDRRTDPFVEVEQKYGYLIRTTMMIVGRTSRHS